MRRRRDACSLALAFAIAACATNDDATTKESSWSTQRPSAGSDRSGACRSDERICDGVCTDLRSSPTSCGRCGRACSDGDVCSAGMCPVGIVRSLGGAVGGIAPYEAGFVWSAEPPSMILRAKTKEAPDRSLAPSGGGPRGLAVRGAWVFFGATKSASIARVPLAGGVSETIATDQIDVEGLAADDDSVFFTVGVGEVRRVGHEGGAVTTIATRIERPEAIVLDASSAYVVSREGASRGLWRVEKDGSGATKIFAGNVRGLAIDATHVYFGNEKAAMLLRVPKSGGAPSTLATEVVPTSLSVDAHDVYFATTASAVVRVPKYGGPIESLAVNEDIKTAMFTDDHFVYWVAGSELHTTIK